LDSQPRLSSGTRLGPYEIVGPIGAGGMGEVFKARDTRLERTVAIKVLPADFAANAQLKLRFEREARLISQLNHPNICTVHDVGEGYLVMELLDGEPLSERIARGALPVPEVLRYATEIAGALDRAHRAGIVHRDLKPANVMITKTGAKLLDFGLAKSSIIDVAMDGPTEHKPLTREGTILGTFQYMAPEQLEGEEADARTDIFSFGAMLYEMATGRRAFDGKTKTSLIAAIVKEHPRPIAELQPLTPPALQHVIDKCLEKDPEDRWQNTGDLASELKWISSAGSQPDSAIPVVAKRATRRRLGLIAALGWIAAVVATLAAVRYAAHWRTASRVTQTEIEASLIGGLDAPLAVSPDGRYVATAVVSGATQKIAVRDLATGTSKLIAQTDGASFPFWSPDSGGIGFFTAGKLKTVQLDSGAVRTICDAPYGRGGTWNSEGDIVFAPNIAAPLMRVSDNGGTPVAVTSRSFVPGGSHRNPAFLPDGKHFLYCAAKAMIGPRDVEVRVGSLDGSVDRHVLDYASNAAVVDGWLLSVRDRNLTAQRFDSSSFAATGKPVAIAQNVDWYGPRYQGSFAVGGDTIVYQHAAQPKLQLLRLDLADPRPGPISEPAFLAGPSLSPDGQRMIINRFDDATGASDLWLYDLNGRPPARLTFDNHGNMEDSAVFSPDGQRVAVATFTSSGISSLWIQPAAGGSHEAISTSGFTVFADWSADGRSLLVNPQNPKTGNDIAVINLGDDRQMRPLVSSAANETWPRFSPDNKWVTYMSDESGRNEIYVTNYPAASAKWQVSSDGGTRPFWSGDGHRLYWLAADRVVSAAVRTEPSFSAEAPRPVEAIDISVADFAVAPNGRIVVLHLIDAGRPPLSVITHWQELLRK